MQSGDDGARRQLIESKLGLVVAIARQHEGQGLRLIDLIQEGNIWLTRAVDRYDWRKGERLSSEATRWIGRGITEALQGPMAGAS
jgi:RNA polymerase primary sigma factor